MEDTIRYVRRKGGRNYCISSASKSPYTISLSAKPFNKVESALVWLLNRFTFYNFFAVSAGYRLRKVLEGAPTIELLGVGYDSLKELYDADKKTFKADYYYNRG